MLSYLLKNVKKQNSRTSASSLLEQFERKSEGTIQDIHLECYASHHGTKNESKKRTPHSMQNYEYDRLRDTDIVTTHRHLTLLEVSIALADVNTEYRM